MALSVTILWVPRKAIWIGVIAIITATANISVAVSVLVGAGFAFAAGFGFVTQHIRIAAHSPALGVAKVAGRVLARKADLITVTAGHGKASFFAVAKSTIVTIAMSVAGNNWGQPSYNEVPRKEEDETR